MKIIWTFTLLMIPGVVSSISVTGYSGGGVIITCRYYRKYTDNAKYFCKGENPGCSDLIKTEVKGKWFHSGRFSLYDDISAAVFTVTIRDLSEQDSGTYQCASDLSWRKDSYTEVKLNVLTSKPTTVCETMGKADIWLIRTYWDFEYPRPLLPNFKFVGGLHCKPAKPLPKRVSYVVHFVVLFKAVKEEWCRAGSVQISFKIIADVKECCGA
ncbi:polymeric immunoglobulin receptor-like protein [Labeo rohita]|nr:polymeric immunoglobulin receptor-like protein [Labeo rohita]